MISINLSIGYQNVEGLHSGLFGCKLDSEITFSCDIEIIAETWSACENCKAVKIPGYEFIDATNPEKKGKKGRSSGGIQVYCKTQFKKFIKVCKKADKYIWLEINKNLFYNLESNLKICAIYSQPSLSKYYRDSLWDDLESDIIDLSSDDSPICIIGDMNGRTGERSDFELADKYVNSIPSKLIKSCRKSCDKLLNKVGEKLLSLCKAYDIQIANGRFPGDFLGNFTHHNKNTGQSAVDLALLSDVLFPCVQDFKVLPQNVYSDHSKIILCINNMKPTEKEEEYEWQRLPPKYKWKEEVSPDKYKEALNSEAIRDLISDCNQRIDAGLVESSGVLLQTIFQKAADDSLETTPAKTPNSPTKRKKKGKKSKKKWFDEDCYNSRKTVKKLANLKHRNPTNKYHQMTHREAMRQYKKICRGKKYDFWKEQCQNLDQLDSHSEFWDEWKSFGENQRGQTSTDLGGKSCENFFQGLFAKITDDINPVLEKIQQRDNQFLNKKFSLQELEDVIKGLYKKKSVGPDLIANEFLKLATPELLNLILKYLNLNLRQGITCKNWCYDLITLIHKEGPKDDPNNYRGICIMNALLKVLCTLLNNRLTDYCAEQKLIDIKQIGFERFSRASDHIFTLKTVVNKYVVDERGKKLYTCFVDFKKAFDSVWHDALFRKLENKGINGKFLDIIRNIYKQTRCAVKINGKATKYFKYEKGVQQGNPLSPILFNLFINDIFEEIRNNSQITLDGESMVHALMYADDLIIMATSPEELQRSLDGLSKYCEKWKLNVNIKKTQCMTFSKGTNVRKHPFKINGKLVEHTREYKYLGININAKNCSFSPTLTNLSAKATRAIYAITSKLPIRNAPIKTMLRLFDFCVSPILQYGSEIWAPYLDHDWEKWDTTQIERTHTKFLKRVLGVNRSTTNVMVRSELGRYPLQERILKRNITYIRYMDEKPPTSLVWNALRYEEAQENSNCQRKTIFSLINRYKQNILEENENTVLEKVKEMEENKIRNTIRFGFEEAWKEQLNNFSKTDTFKQFKNKIQMEPYLNDIKNRKMRVAITKLRLSDHCLMIEDGRHQRPIISRDQRFCPYCPGEIENEEHFFTKCTAYDRAPLFNRITLKVPQFGNLDDHNKFVYIMTQADDEVTNDIAQEVYGWVKKRLDTKKQEKEIEQFIISYEPSQT